MCELDKKVHFMLITLSVIARYSIVYWIEMKIGSCIKNTIYIQHCSSNIALLTLHIGLSAATVVVVVVEVWDGDIR